MYCLVVLMLIGLKDGLISDDLMLNILTLVLSHALLWF